jgi:hypothetical protein
MDEMDELLRRLATSGSVAAPSAHFRAACAARGSVPLPEGTCRVVVAAPRASFVLDLTLAELRRELTGGDFDVRRHDHAARAMALVLLDDPVCLMRKPFSEESFVRQALGYLGEGVLGGAPPGWNTLGLDVDVVGGEVRVRPVLSREPWLPLLPPSRPGRGPRR